MLWVRVNYYKDIIARYYIIYYYVFNIFFIYLNNLKQKSGSK